LGKKKCDSKTLTNAGLGEKGHLNAEKFVTWWYRTTALAPVCSNARKGKVGPGVNVFEQSLVGAGRKKKNPGNGETGLKC